MNSLDSTETHDLPTRRRRSFIAVRRSDREEPDIAIAGSGDDDIPLLTEIIVQEELHAPEEKPVTDASAAIDARAEELARQMVQALGQQLALALPTLIEAALAQAGKELGAAIAPLIDTELNNLLTGHMQLNVPPDGVSADE